MTASKSTVSVTQTGQPGPGQKLDICRQQFPNSTPGNGHGVGAAHLHERQRSLKLPGLAGYGRDNFFGSFFLNLV